MNKIRFFNKEGKEFNTTMSDDIMNKVADLTELELQRNRIYYSRNGTVFNVRQDDVNRLLNAQSKATKQMFDDGVITKDIMEEDIKANF